MTSWFGITGATHPPKIFGRPSFISDLFSMKSLEGRVNNLNEHHESMIPVRQTEELRERWTAIQASFVDEPRKAVEEADHLVASAIKQIEEVFAAQRSNLEKQWTRGDQISTEDLRVSLQHYRD